MKMQPSVCTLLSLFAPIFNSSDSFKNTSRPFRAGQAVLLLTLALFSMTAFAESTTISGTVYMPNGTDVLPNVLVYVTTGTATVPASGAKCPGTEAEGCITASTILPVVVGSGTGVYAYTYTAVDGTFTLSDVPENTNYTLVIQSGKWMSEFTEDVSTTAITGIVLEMPSSHNAGFVNPQPTSTLTAAQGNIPLIAIATGNADAVECVLRKTNYGLGLSDCEFTDDNGTAPTGTGLVGNCSGATGGRIHFYQGDKASGAVISSSTPLETALIAGTSTTPLTSYDLLMLPCQGAQITETSTNIDKLIDYTSKGGRVSATHYSDTWLDTTETYGGYGFSGAATYTTSSTPTASGGTLGGTNPYGIGSINTDFTAGSTLSSWLYESGYAANGTLGTPDSGTDGKVEISSLRIQVASTTSPTQTWLTLDPETGDNYSGSKTFVVPPIMQMSFNTPVGAAENAQYGRVMFNDYHVENVSGVTGENFPEECPTLAGESQVAQEKMLEYALFDLTNAVTPVVVPSMTITLGNSPATFNEGDSADTITVDVVNGSTALSATTALPITLGITLPSGLTATAIAETDSTGGWSCSVSTLTCTQTTGIAASANYTFDVTVSVAANATAGATTASEPVAASVSSQTFSTKQTGTLSITADEHAAVTWATPAAITYGTALSSTQLDAVGNAGGNNTPNANGTYVYSPVSGTVLSAGSYTLTVTYTPGSGYSSYTGSGTASVTLTVNQATPTISISNIPSGAVYNGSVMPTYAYIGDGTTSVTSNSPSICTVSGSQINFVGLGTCSLTASATAGTNYTAVTGSAQTFSVGKATANPTLGNLSPTYNGNPIAATFSIIPANLASEVTLTYTGINGTFYAQSNVPPTNAGSYMVVATLTDTNYTGTATGTMTISQATPTITWAAPAAITYGTALSGTQLDASSAVAGTFAYTPALGTVLRAGSGQTLSVTFTPTDTTDYATPAAATTTITVNQATPTITWPTASNLTYGQTLSSSILSGGASTPAGTFTFTTTTTAPPVGTAAQSVTFTPTDTTDYNTVVGSANVTVTKATANPVLGNLLPTYTGSGIAATATITPASLASEVTFTYTGINGTNYPQSNVPPTNAGSYTVVATLTDTNYTGTATGTMTISKVTPSAITWPTASNLTYGQTLASSILSGGASTPAGTFAFTTPTTAPPVGMAAQSVTFTPNDTTDYDTVVGSANVTVTKATPSSITWPAASNLTYGQTLASSTLSGGASTPAGTFTFTTTTTAPPVGTAAQAVTFTPNDTTDYDTVVGSANVTVIKATANPVLGNLLRTYTGSGIAATATITPASLASEVTFTYTGINGTNYPQSNVPPTNAGSYTVVATLTDTNYTGTTTGTLVISKGAAAVTLTPSSLNQTYTGSPLSVTSTTNPAGLNVTYTYNGSSTAPIPPGSYAVVATINDPNYTGTTSGTLVVSKAALGVPFVNVTSNANPVMAQSAITFTATISATTGQPTGTVIFLDGTTVLGQGTLSNGVATLTSSSLAAGSHSITVAYGGDSNFAATTSGVLAQTVLDFTLNPVSTGGGNGSSQTVNSGAAAKYTLAIVPTTGNDFPTPTTLTISGMPTGATATITPSSWTQLTNTSWSFPANTAFTNLGLTIQVPATTVSQNHQRQPGGKFPPVLWGILLLPFAGRMRRASKRLGCNIFMLLMLVAGMVAMAGLSGCASGKGTGTGFYDQQPQTYTIVVTATSSALTHSTTLTLTVQ
jgi:hypothetical protein